MVKPKNWQLFKLFFDQCENPATISTIDGKYLYVNQAYLRLRGKNEKELVGQYWWDTFADRETRCFVHEYYKIILKNKCHKYRVEYQAQEDESVVVDWISQTMFDPDSRENFICDLGKDATTEMKLKTQLIHTQKIESLGILAGGIAHEFNNILTSIIGYTSFLKGYLQENSKEKSYISKIQKAALGAAGLTSKLLGFARKGKSIEKLVNVNLIVKEVFDIIKSTFSKSIRVQLDLGDKMYYVLADYDQIYQSLMNLVINSQDVMKEGGDITISTQIKDYLKQQKYHDFVVPAGKYVYLSVSDTGPGMDEAICNRIFEPFFTTKPAGEGTGLGLSMVYGMVKGHRGFIFVNSKPGEGTTFEIILPAVSQIKDSSASDDSGFFPIFSQMQKKTILIVDDEVEILDYLENVLTEYGYNILKAVNGKVAIDIYKKEKVKPDLLLLDIVMPVLDGKKVIQKLSRINPALKIIVITSYATEKVIQDIKSLGINYFLFKPFKVSNLMELISKVIEEEEFD